MVGAVTATTVVSVYNYVPAVKVALNVLKFAKNVVKAAKTVHISVPIAEFVRTVLIQMVDRVNTAILATLVLLIHQATVVHAMPAANV